MLKKVKCINCKEEVMINTDIPDKQLENIQCERCAKSSKKECNERAK